MLGYLAAGCRSLIRLHRHSDRVASKNPPAPGGQGRTREEAREKYKVGRPAGQLRLQAREGEKRTRGGHGVGQRGQRTTPKLQAPRPALVAQLRAPIVPAASISPKQCQLYFSASAPRFLMLVGTFASSCVGNKKDETQRS